jgi:hypothetical protein
MKKIIFIALITALQLSATTFAADQVDKTNPYAVVIDAYKTYAGLEMRNCADERRQGILHNAFMVKLDGYEQLFLVVIEFPTTRVRQYFDASKNIDVSEPVPVKGCPLDGQTFSAFVTIHENVSQTSRTYDVTKIAPFDLPK